MGYNLQDHIALGGLTFLVNDTVSIVGRRVIENADNLFNYIENKQGPLADPAGSEALAFFNTKNMNDPDGYPNLELLFLAGSFASMESFRKSFAVKDEIFDVVSHFYKLSTIFKSAPIPFQFYLLLLFFSIPQIFGHFVFQTIPS